MTIDDIVPPFVSLHDNCPVVLHSTGIGTCVVMMSYDILGILPQFIADCLAVFSWILPSRAGFQPGQGWSSQKLISFKGNVLELILFCALCWSCIVSLGMFNHNRGHKSAVPPPTHAYRFHSFLCICSGGFLSFLLSIRVVWQGHRPEIWRRLREFSAEDISCIAFIDLLMGLFRGAVFRHAGGVRKQHIKQPTDMPTSTMALMGRFPSLVGRFHLNGACPRFHLKGPFTS